MTLDLCHQLESFLDGTLSVDASNSFQLHLEDCQSCKEQIAQLRELEGLICDAWNDVHPQSNLQPANRNVREPTSLQSRRRRVIWTSLLGLAGAITFAAFVTSNPNTQQSPSASLGEPKNRDHQTEQVAFFDAGSESTMLSPIVSNADFTIVQAFPNSISINTSNLTPSTVNETN